MLIVYTSPSGPYVPHITNLTPPPTKSLKIIPISQLTSFTLLSLPETPATIPSFSQVDVAANQSRLDRAITSEQAALSRRGPKGTAPTEQALFEALARTHPARWDGNKMVISDQYVIEKPYGPGNVALVSGEAGRAGLDRVRRIVEMERAKIDLKMGGSGAGIVGKKGG